MNDCVKELKRRKANNTAKKLINYYGIEAPKHIRLYDIAYDLGLSIISSPLKNAVASLTRLGNNGIIRISDQITHLPRKRFTIAHELGHFQLKHKVNLNKLCNQSEINDWYSYSIENEANIFASELLMPELLFKPICNKMLPSIQTIIKLSCIFNTSITATAIRYIKFCHEPCAIIFSDNSTTKWHVKNKNFYPFIENNKLLSKNSYTYDFYSNKEPEKEMQDVLSDAWLNKNVNLYEGYKNIYDDVVITLLWIKN